jgi:hypothetical protein
MASLRHRTEPLPPAYRDRGTPSGVRGRGLDPIEQCHLDRKAKLTGSARDAIVSGPQAAAWQHHPRAWSPGL